MQGFISHPRKHAVTSTRDHTGTAYRLLYIDSSGEVQELEHGTDGYVLTSNGASSDPTWESTATAFTWSEVTGTSQSAVVNNGYITNNAGLVTVTIPTTAAVGDIVRVVGKGAGGWRIAQNASELIHFGGSVTTTGTGGRLDSTGADDCVELVCVVADTEWKVISTIGVITYT